MLCLSLKFIDTWLKLVESKYTWIYIGYQENMIELFQKISKTEPRPTLRSFRNKNQLILTDIGGKLYVNKMHNPPPPLEKIRLSKEK